MALVIGITNDGWQVFDTGVDTGGRKVVDSANRFLDDGMQYFSVQGSASTTPSVGAAVFAGIAGRMNFGMPIPSALKGV